MLKRWATLAAALAVAAAPLTSHGFGNGTGFETGSCEIEDLSANGAPGSGPLREVGPGKAYSTIQSAVTGAPANTHVVVYPGVYKERVDVNVEGLRITGTDRDGVIIDGENVRDYGIFVHSDRVVLENMTAHNFPLTAFHWRSVTGYWGRYLTAYNTGDYGIFAYDARCGQFDHDYASGVQDGGFYIGECYPCDAVITKSESTENGLGFSGTNAGGNLLLKDSWWHGNALGIVPNSLDGEAAPPQRGVTIENNLIENNSGVDVPGRGPAADFYGVGIAIAGGSGNQIIGNTVRGHTLTGIVLSPLASDTSKAYVPGGNVVWGNKVSGSGLADLAQGATSGPNNCWSHNTYETTAPPVILESVWGCTNTGTDPLTLPYYPGVTPPGGDPRVEAGLVQGTAGLNDRAPGVWQTWPAPTCASNPGAGFKAAPASCVDLPDENGNGDYADDGAVDAWLPALL